MSAVSSKKRLTVSTCVLVGLLGFGLLGFLAGCAGTGKPRVEKEAGELVWPAPPETPRIKFVKEISKPSDVGKGKAASNKLAEALLGVTSKDAKILVKPYGIHADSNGRVYVADSATGRVTVFDSKAKDVLIMGQKGQGRMNKAMGVVAGKDGRVYVTDLSAKRVVVIDSKGKFLKALGGKDVLANPVGIALDEKRGRIYVADSYAHQIVAFNPDGKVLFSIGRKNAPGKLAAGSKDQAWNRGIKEGEFRFPTNVTVDNEGKIYVIDALNFRVQVFNSQGEYLSSFGKLGDGFGQFARPKGVAVDSQGHVYVTDAGFNNVQIFNASGKLLLFFGSMGQGKGEFWLPAGISIDASNRIYVADQYNHRVQVFQFLKQEESATEIDNNKNAVKAVNVVNNEKGGKQR